MITIGKAEINPPVKWRELNKGDHFELARNRWQYIYVGKSDVCGHSFVAMCKRNNKKVLLNKNSKLRFVREAYGSEKSK